MVAAIGNSAHLNKIRKNKTPPSEKDGVCQQSETAEAVSLVANLTRGKLMVPDPFDFN
jgi:hypothetical protein